MRGAKEYKKEWAEKLEHEETVELVKPSEYMVRQNDKHWGDASW